MNKKKYLQSQKKIQPLIRHCWDYNIYKKEESNPSFKEKFINFLTIDGKKSKAYTIFNQIGILTRQKIIQTTKTAFFFDNREEAIQRLRRIVYKKIKIEQQSKKSTQIFSKADSETKKELSIKGASRVGSPKATKLFEKKLGQSPKGMINEGDRMQSIVKKENSRVKLKQKKFSKKTHSLVEQEVIKTRKEIPKKKRLVSFHQFLLQAIENVQPNLEVRKVRKGRTTYLVPSIIRKNRQQTLAIKWLLQSARSKKGGIQSSRENVSQFYFKYAKHSLFVENIVNELLEAFKKQGKARQKRDELHKLAEANRAYIRYRWW